MIIKSDREKNKYERLGKKKDYVNCKKWELDSDT